LRLFEATGKFFNAETVGGNSASCCRYPRLFIFRNVVAAVVVGGVAVVDNTVFVRIQKEFTLSFKVSNKWHFEQ